MDFVQRSPTIIDEDNHSCIAIAKNSMIKSRTKHIKIRYHFTREMIDAGEVQLVYCSTEPMIADALTEEVAQEKLTAFVNEMMLEDKRLDQSGRLEEHEAAWCRSEREQDQDGSETTIDPCL